MYRIVFSLFALLFTFVSFAQRGKMPNPNISATVIANEYTSLTNSVSAGATSIAVTNSGLNTNARFSGNLAQGDLLMIIQMQGVLTNATPFINRSEPNDTTWGTILNYNNCGRYEFVEVLSVPNNSTINLSCPLTNSYTDTGKVQVIRVPRYASLTINGAGTIQAQPWNGTTGGVVAIEVLGNTTINGQINVNGQGFRGGALDPNSLNGGGFYAAPNNAEGAEKGEGVGGSAIDYAKYLGRYCMGAPANGGGGGTAHNAGGGGGGNAGNINNWRSGRGNPDISNAGWVTAWNLEFGGFGSVTWSASGGGRGGYSWSNTNRDATVEGPGNTNWGGDNRRNIGGKGGRPLDYSTGRIFMGGGGGAGDQNDADGSAGANGGGLVFLQTYGTVSGSGSVNANGTTAADTDDSGTSFTLRGQDGAGGGGAGGTILIQSTGAISSITCNANGGNGGNQKMRYWTTIPDAYGPGGGGGGGYIAISNGTITRNTNGGANGIVSSTTSSIPVSEFPPNGATGGGVGNNNATIAAYNLVAIHDTVCFGQTANLGVSVVGTLPGSSTVNWYTLAVGGSPINTGLTYNPTNVTSPDTFYVGVCPGTFRIAVYLSIAPAPTANAGQDTSICSGDTVQLSASGGGTYAWDPNPNLSATNIPNPLAFPSSTMYFYVTVTNSNGCTSRDSVLVTISSALVIDAGSDTTICNGASVQLNATGGVNYTWDANSALSATNISNPIASPSITQYFYVTGNNGAGCNGRDSVLVSISPQMTSGISNDTTICQGTNVNIFANVSGGTPIITYSWNQGLGNGASKNVSPTSTTTYIVTITDGANCSIQDSVTVSLFPVLSSSITASDTAICLGDSVILTAITSGGNGGLYSFTWSDGITNIGIANPIVVYPSGNTTYTVTVTDNCTSPSSTAQIPITITSKPNVSITASPDNSCAPLVTTFTVVGNNNYTYSWDYDGNNTTDFTSTNTTANYTYVNPGTYFPIVTVSNGGCDTVITFTTPIQVNLTPTANFSAQPNPSAPGESISFTDFSNFASSWYWSFGDGDTAIVADTNHIYATAGNYTVCLTIDYQGCNDSICKEIVVIGEIIVPNVFSPNGDGDNDLFVIEGLWGIGNSLQVYNRWGQIIYRNENYNNTWDGNNSNGVEVPEGTYFAIFTTKDGEVYKQTVTLIK